MTFQGQKFFFSIIRTFGTMTQIFKEFFFLKNFQGPINHDFLRFVKDIRANKHGFLKNCFKSTKNPRIVYDYFFKDLRVNVSGFLRIFIIGTFKEPL